MVDIVSIGVLAIQGAVSEHITLMSLALKETHTPGTVYAIKTKKELDHLDALVIPGGETTTISKVLFGSGLHHTILHRINNENLAVMGTCAGCVLLAKKTVNDDNKLQLFQVMNMHVQRNAFGRQRESFEQNICFNGFSTPYHAVFIRAPVITKVWGDCEILAQLDKKVIAARQKKFLALSFHPELTNDLRIHKYFLEMI